MTNTSHDEYQHAETDPGPGGRTLFFHPEDVYFLRADGHDAEVRTRRSWRYRSSRRIAELERELPPPPLFPLPRELRGQSRSGARAGPHRRLPPPHGRAVSSSDLAS